MFSKQLYSIWVIFSISIFFFLFIVPLLICSLSKSLHKLALRINYVWAWGFFKIAFIKVEPTWLFKPDRSQPYILCANHFSYLDIPALGLFPYPFKFVGKSQLSSIPVFGFMYNRIHITVNRSSYRSRAHSLARAREELKNGFSIGFFPEGGIKLKEFPKMENFKDGAFRLAVENNTPIIPIIFPNNYKILADDDLMSMTRTTCKIIYHQPVYPAGNSEQDIRELRQEVFRVIQSELDKQMAHS